MVRCLEAQRVSFGQDIKTCHGHGGSAGVRSRDRQAASIWTVPAAWRSDCKKPQDELRNKNLFGNLLAWADLVLQKWGDTSSTWKVRSSRRLKTQGLALAATRDKAAVLAPLARSSKPCSAIFFRTSHFCSQPLVDLRLQLPLRTSSRTSSDDFCWGHFLKTFPRPPLRTPLTNLLS